MYEPTNKGNLKLVYNEYTYFKSTLQANGAQAWRCRNFDGRLGQVCKVRAYTKRFGNYDKVRISGSHNHFPNM